MNELPTKVLDAHGGLERWRSHNKVEATIVTGGGFFALKGVFGGCRSAAHGGMAARGAIVCDAFWRVGSTHDVHP